TKCGTDLKYIKEHKELKPIPVSRAQVSNIQYQTDYVPHKREKISDENLVNNKEHELWSPGASIGLTMAAFMMMNAIVAGIMIVVAFLLLPFDMDALVDLAYNSYFISISLIFELVLIIIPLLYVGKYIQNPTLKNRLILLGFTTRGYNRKKILKEILIGLSFGIIGLATVFLLSIAIEVMLELIFRINIIDTGSSTSLVIPSDIPSLIFFSIVMMLVIGTSEELLFRGFMQKGLVRRLGSKWGILITALIFSMIHVITVFLVPFESLLFILISFILLFIPYFAISLLLGLIYHWRRENLIAVIITHGFYDVLTIIMAYLLYIAF
ncbi:MAG: CPBP family intramembrane glutamic endopeptidase, partial [Promethearchaeota archaeon]